MNKNNKAKRIGIIHPKLIEGGGSEARALYIAEALKNNYNITIITTYLTSLSSLNEYYGTSLTPKDIKIIGHPFSPFLKRIKYFNAIRGALFSRFCKNIAGSFDLLISAYNVMDFGKEGIQFIADFSFSDKLRRKFTPRKQGLKNSFYNENVLRKIYLSFGHFLSGISQEGYKKNLTIANSKWSAEVLRKKFGIESEVIYPPVVSGFPVVPWDKKKNGFIYIGRLVPEKKIDFIIEVLDKVRKCGFDIHFHIIGPLDNSTYVKYLKRIVKMKGDWIKLEGAKFKKDKQKLLAEHRYGITAHPNEAFGISIAEMVKAGCIVWVPDGGGQAEIVDSKKLTFKNNDDAIQKIAKVLKSNKLQEELKKHLKKQSLNFSAEIFKKEVKKLVKNYLENRT